MLTSGAPSCSRALKRNLFSVRTGTITHLLVSSGQRVAVLAAGFYFALRAFAVPMSLLIPLTLALLTWLYILVAGAPPSGLRSGVVATLVLGALFFGRQVSPV